MDRPNFEAEVTDAGSIAEARASLVEIIDTLPDDAIVAVVAYNMQTHEWTVRAYNIAGIPSMRVFLAKTLEWLGRILKQKGSDARNN